MAARLSETRLLARRMRILVMASTFPRWRSDTVPPFVKDLSTRLVGTGPRDPRPGAAFRRGGSGGSDGRASTFTVSATGPIGRKPWPTVGGDPAEICVTIFEVVGTRRPVHVHAVLRNGAAVFRRHRIDVNSTPIGCCRRGWLPQPAEVGCIVQLSSALTAATCIQCGPGLVIAC